MNADQFRLAFARKMAALKPQGDSSREWTSGIYPVLYEVGTEAGLDVNCKPFEHKGQPVGNRELLLVDFMYFPHRLDTDGYIYYQPIVVIKHENNWDYCSKRDDFWKVCLFASRLRVFIGYCSTKAEAEKQAKELTEFYQRHELAQLPDAETMIQVSWPEAVGQEWIVWLLKGRDPTWQFVSEHAGDIR
jgi:hypothetical protein